MGMTSLWSILARTNASRLVSLWTFYAVDNSCTALSHDCVCKEKGGTESGSSSYIFFRSSEFSPHVNTGSKISLFQSFNSYVVAKCKFNVGVFRYLTSNPCFLDLE